MSNQCLGVSAPPFSIGTLFCKEDGLFGNTCANKELPISDISIKENAIQFEIALDGNISFEKFAKIPSNMKHIVVGVEMFVDNTDSGKYQKIIKLLADSSKGYDLLHHNLPGLHVNGVEVYQLLLLPVNSIKLSATSSSTRNIKHLIKKVVSHWPGKCSGQSLKIEREHLIKVLSKDSVKFLLGKTNDSGLHYLSNVVKEIEEWSGREGRRPEERPVEKYNEGSETVIESLNIAACLVMLKCESPKNKVEIELPCPKGCSGDYYKWTCFKCKTRLNYGFDGRFYCLCGGAKFEDFRFKCNHVGHGEKFVELDPKIKKHLVSLKPLKESNVVKNELAETTSRKRQDEPSQAKPEKIGMSESVNLNFMLCNGVRTKEVPNNKVELQAPCSRACSEDFYEWTCFDCKTNIYYGFDAKFYCECGGAKYEDFGFRCKLASHGETFVPLHPDVKDYLDNMKPRKELNLLLLGETGVGKSTFVNALLNYMFHAEFDDAKGKIITAVPTKFSVTDNDLVTHVISMGKHENEDQVVGHSATQQCRTYTLQLDECNVRFIDTPGMGDSRGLDQDRINLKKILAHIRHFDELHGICLMLKPNETRISVLMKFCVKQIIHHLHKDCTKNLIYCFSHARSTFYRPGDTLPLIQKLLAEADIDSSLNKANTFCVDNESYRYLCTLQNPAIRYSDEDHEIFAMSWKRSVAETRRMLEFAGTLQPHKTAGTLSLNQAKAMVVTLAVAVADIALVIAMNIAVMEEHLVLIGNWNRSEAEWANQIYIPQIVLVPKRLDYPRTVCTNKTCVMVETLPQTGQEVTHYTMHCHTKCYLTHINADCYPNPELKSCSAFKNCFCTVCGCRWDKHRHITYELIPREEEIWNREAERQIRNAVDAREKKEAQVDALKERRKSLLQEKETILAVTAHLKMFLREHSLTENSDVFAEHLASLIEQERDKFYSCQTSQKAKVIKQLEETLAMYNTALVKCDRQNGGSSIDDVQTYIGMLYSLPTYGKQLREVIKIGAEAEKSAAKHDEVTFCNPYQTDEHSAESGKDVTLTQLTTGSLDTAQSTEPSDPYSDMLRQLAVRNECEETSNTSKNPALAKSPINLPKDINNGNQHGYYAQRDVTINTKTLENQARTTACSDMQSQPIFRNTNMLNPLNSSEEAKKVSQIEREAKVSTRCEEKQAKKEWLDSYSDL